jgi:hypothetical protein
MREPKVGDIYLINDSKQSFKHWRVDKINKKTGLIAYSYCDENGKFLHIGSGQYEILNFYKDLKGFTLINDSSQTNSSFKINIKAKFEL